MQYFLFIFLAPFAGAVILLTLIYTWQRRNSSGARALLAYLVAVAGFLVTNSLELLSPTPGGTLFWAKFSYVFIGALPVAWLAFSLQFTGKNSWLAPERFWLFTIEPVITLLLVLSTEMNGMVWSRYSFLETDGFLTILIEHGPWFWVHFFYTYVLIAIGIVMIARTYFGSHRIFRQQALWIIVGIVPSLIANLVYVSHLFPGFHQDFTSIAFALSGLVFAMGIFRYRLLNLGPVAREFLVDTMPDGLLVLDPGLRVVDLNPATCEILALPIGEELVGRPLGDLWPEIRTWTENPADWPEMARFERVGYRKIFGLRVSPFHLPARANWRAGLQGWLVVLSDITQRVDAEEALALANQSLAEANLALRHANDDLVARIAARTVALTQRATELEALSHVSSEMRKAAGLEELLNILLDETLDVLEARAGVVFLLEEDDLVLTAGKSVQARLGKRLSPCPDPLWRVVETGVTLHLSASQSVREPASDLFHSLIGSGSELLLTPVRAANRILGLLFLIFDRPLADSLGEKTRLLTAIAEMSANALQRVRMVENLESLVQARTRDVSALYEVTATTNLPLDLPDLLQRVLASVLNVLGLRAAVLHLVEEPILLPQTGVLQRTFLSSWPGGGQHSLPNELSIGIENKANDLGVVIEPYPLFLAAHAGLDKASLHVLPSTSDPSSPWVQVLRQRGVVVLPTMPAPLISGNNSLSACVSVPVRSKGRTLGVLSVLVESIDRFSAEDIALLAALSDHVGGAVERARLRKRAEEAAVIEERQRLARDLHDSVTQTLYSLVLFAEAGIDALHAGNQEKVTSHLDHLRETAQQALKEMRLLIYELRPLALQSVGLVGALRNRLETVERRAGIDARLVIDNFDPLPERIESGLYGIAQEALNNVIKHARASQLTLRLCGTPHWVEMEISDNGQGFPDEGSMREGGIGLSSMRERARALGGELSIRSEAGHGAKILVKIYQEANQ